MEPGSRVTWSLPECELCDRLPVAVRSVLLFTDMLAAFRRGVVLSPLQMMVGGRGLMQSGNGDVNMKGGKRLELIGYLGHKGGGTKVVRVRGVGRRRGSKRGRRWGCERRWAVGGEGS